MKLAPDTMKALDAWLNHSTWSTNHPLDMNRFYDFVDQYQKTHGYTMDEPALWGIIETRFGDTLTNAQRKTIRTQISVAYRILEFLQQTGR